VDGFDDESDGTALMAAALAGRADCVALLLRAVR
jgi:ankyrin repeat protein